MRIATAAMTRITTSTGEMSSRSDGACTGVIGGEGGGAGGGELTRTSPSRRTAADAHPCRSALGGLLLRLLQPLERLAVRLDVAAVEIAELDTIGEQDAVALPVEPVRQDHLADGAGLGAVQLDDRANLVAHAQVELIGVRPGQRVRLPHRHFRRPRRITSSIMAERWCHPATPGATSPHR